MRVTTLYSPIFATALAAMAYTFALSGGNFSILVLSQAGVLLCAIFGLLLPGHRALTLRYTLLICVISLTMIASVLFNVANYSESGATIGFALLHIIGVIGMLFGLQWAAINLVPELLLQQLTKLLLPLAALAIAQSLMGTEPGGRQSPFGIHPNWWGELGFALTACSLAMPSWKARLLPIGAAMLLFLLVQSRGALLAAVGTLGVYWLTSTTRPILLRPRRLALASGLLIATVIFAIVLQHAVLGVWLYIRDDVLLWNNPYRGIGTGLTGRLDGWREAIHVFLANPILGQGIDTLPTIHNGFLQLAGEGGVMLLLSIAILMGTSVRNAVKTSNHLAISIVAGYTFYAMTYPRMLNMNLAAAVFYLSLFPWNRSRFCKRIRKADFQVSNPLAIQPSE